MDTNQIVFLFRGIERLMIVSGAIVCVVMGIRLYGGRVTFGGKSDIEAEGAGLKIKFSNAAPGAILALFGMVVMGVALRSPARMAEAPSAGQASASAPAVRRSDVALATPAEGGAAGAAREDSVQTAAKPANGSANPPNKELGSIQYGALDDAAVTLVRELAADKLKNPRAKLGYYKERAQPLRFTKKKAYQGLLQQLVAIPDSDSDEQIASKLFALKATANALP